MLHLSYFNGGIPMDTEYSFGDEVHTFCLKLTHGISFQFWMALSVIHYCAFVKNTGTLKFKSCLYNCCCVFVCHQSLLQSQATHLKTWKHKKWMDIHHAVTNHKPWPFEPIEVNFCFLRGLLRWLTAVKNANVSWLLNLSIRVFLKSAVIKVVISDIL